MTSSAHLDLAFLERRRLLAFRSAAIALVVAAVAFPLGMSIGGSDTSDSISGAFLLAGIIGVVAAPWIVRAWQGFMRRRMLAATVANRTDIRHIDAEKDASGRAALSSDAFDLGAFQSSGLVERFQSAAVHHILAGEAQGVAFAIAELALLDAKGLRMFGGVLASFRLASPRPGLTIVTRDRGLLGNLLAHAGSGIERLPLEDPDFEGVFEVYGDDQVGGRVILTTTMLERLKALDELAHARGFACAFRGEHLLIAFSGMSWRCPIWRILKPVDTWLPSYAEWITGLVDLPRDIVKTLDLVTPSRAATVLFVPEPREAVQFDSGSGQVVLSGVFRLVGEVGEPLAYVASGALFGGVALFGGWYGITEGYSSGLFWYFWGMIAAGLAYGAYAIALGGGQILKFVWRWNAPLRALNRR